MYCEDGIFAFAWCFYEILVLVNFVQEDQGIYARLVKDMIQDDKYRLVVNINDLRRKNPARTTRYNRFVFLTFINVQHGQVVQIVKC